MRNDEREPVLTIPPVVGVVVVRVEAPTIVVTVRVEEVRIAIGIVRDPIRATAPRILSGLYIIRHRNALKSRTKYHSFFQIRAPLYPKP